MRKAYFKAAPHHPAPLAHTVERAVRFEEVDPLGIVWHGRYPSYFEDARVAHGNHYGIGYLDFHRERVLAPVKQMHVDYMQPLRFGQSCTITALLHWSDAARVNYEFQIRDDAGEITTTGYSIQLFVEESGVPLMYPPDFYLAFLERWKTGGL
jgi:acyl-CoA thioester hydrolase